jgi:hypothetical protein
METQEAEETIVVTEEVVGKEGEPLETEPKKIKTLLGHDWRINLSALSG